jgi:hypothetical protein
MKKLINKYRQSSYLSSTGLLFVINIIVGIFNFTLLFVINFTISDTYSQWLALSGLLNIVLAPIAGLSTHTTRSFAKLKATDPNSQNPYYYWLKKKMLQAVIIVIVASPLLAIAVYMINRNFTYLSILLIFIYLALYLYVQLNQHILLGIKQVKYYAFLLFVQAFFRFIVSITLIMIGFEIIALPLGYLISGLFVLLFGEWLMTRYFAKHNQVKDQLNDHNFKLGAEFLQVLKTGIVLQLIALFLSSNIFIANLILSENDGYIYAISYTFGQMVYFVGIASLGAFLTHASASKDIKLYKSTIKGVGLLTSLAAIGLLSALVLLNRLWDRISMPELGENILVTTLVLIFIIGFNFVYVSIQYLLSQNNYSSAFRLGYFLILSFIFYVLLALFEVTNKLLIFTVINVIFANIAAIYFYLHITSKPDEDT